jgi:hypothetical protein
MYVEVAQIRNLPEALDQLLSTLSRVSVLASIIAVFVLVMTITESVVSRGKQRILHPVSGAILFLVLVLAGGGDFIADGMRDWIQQ